MSYKAILFDLGNVLIKIRFDRGFKYWSEKSGKNYDEIVSWFSEDEVYQKHERAEVTGREYYQHVVKSLDMPLSYEDFVEGWNAIFAGTIPETMAFIDKYKTQLTYLTLTNSNVLHREVWSKDYESDLVPIKKIYCSSQIQARKPEPRAYEYVLKDSGFDATEVIFVDDKVENIEAAEALGIKSVLFTDPKKDIQVLESLVTA